MIQWGQAEQSLDLCVAMLWHEFNARNSGKKQRIPMMLAPKITFLREAFDSIPELALLKQQAGAVFDEFDRLGNLRDDMTHGAVVALEPIGGCFVLNKLDIRDGFHHVREVKIPIADYPKLAGDLVALGRNAHGLGVAITRIRHPAVPPIK